MIIIIKKQNKQTNTEKPTIKINEATQSFCVCVLIIKRKIMAINQQITK